jgi:hypothetical protein
LALVLAGLFILLGALTASAMADPYGELGAPFGEAHEAKEIKPGQLNYEGAHAFAVDPTDDSVYVGDELEPEINPITAKEFKFFRIQKFSATGQHLATAVAKLSEGEHAFSLAGIAVDTGLKRVYMLVVAQREKAPDIGPAAGSLYGFSTEPKGEALESVAGSNGKGEPLPLANEKVLTPQAAKAREALLKPGGIAVDPTTHDVIVTGLEDESNKEELKAALARIHSNGTLGNRSVDDTNCLFEGVTSGGEPHCAEVSEGEPVSPVVDASGKVYVTARGSDQIWQIPTPETEKLPNGEFKTLPKQLFALPTPQTGAHLLSFAEEAGEGEEARGDEMALVPEGEEEGKGVGRIYVGASIQQNEEVGGHLNASGFPFPGLIVFDYTENKATGVLETAAEAGWAGGPATGAKCQIEAPGSVTALLGGASEKGAFVFAFGKGKQEGGEELSPVTRIHKFGPSGEGCPHARLTSAGTGGIKAVANLEEKGGVFSPKDEVVFSSEVFQADAVSVKWEFENVATHEKQEYASGKDEFQAPVVPPLKFEKEGEYKVRETIHTDDLASPEIKAERTIKVEGRPSASIRGTTPVSIGVADTFHATVGNPNGGSYTYVWNFGDGNEAAPASSTAQEVSTAHAYGAPGSYTVTLTVTDRLGFSGKATLAVLVTKPAPPPTTSSSSSPAPPPPPAQTPPPGGNSGVLSYSASFAGTSLSVSAKGAFVIKVNCGGQSSCSGTVTLRTLSAVSAGAHRRKAILTLASGSFSVAGGHRANVTLHLSPKARVLLARSHTLRVRATIVGRDSAGNAHTTLSVVTLRAAAAHRKH